MKILITGGSGFIASYFYGPLLAAGHEIINCDLVDPSPHAAGAAFVRVDVRDRLRIGRAMRGCEAVLHLAAAHHDFGIGEQTYFDVNEGGAAAICDALDHHGIRKACFFSTVAIYGSAPPPHHEQAPVAPRSAYGRSKLAGEEVFRRWTEQGDGRQCLVIRPTATMGPRQFANMYSLIRQIDSGRFLSVGKGQNIKSLAYAENLVAATLSLWLDNISPLEPFEAFNYVDKPDLTSTQIATTIYSALGRRPARMSVPLPLALAMALPFDLITAATGRNLPISSERVRKFAAVETKFEADKVRATGFRPQASIKDGLRRMVEWYLVEGKDQRARSHRPPPVAMLPADQQIR